MLRRRDEFPLISLVMALNADEPKRQTTACNALKARKPSYRSTRQGKVSYSHRPLNINRGRLAYRDLLLHDISRRRVIFEKKKRKKRRISTVSGVTLLSINHRLTYHFGRFRKDMFEGTALFSVLTLF